MNAQTQVLDRAPEPIRAAVATLFDALPLDQAMRQIVVRERCSEDLRQLVDGIVAQPAIAEAPVLAAGLWLYVDELDASHRISQSGEGEPTHDFWHAIMHRREGDFGNSKYWFRRGGSHPAMNLIHGYNGPALVDAAEKAYDTGEGAEGVIARQREEWATLFGWCAQQA